MSFKKIVKYLKHVVVVYCSPGLVQLKILTTDLEFKSNYYQVIVLPCALIFLCLDNNDPLHVTCLGFPPPILGERKVAPLVQISFQLPEQLHTNRKRRIGKNTAISNVIILKLSPINPKFLLFF